MRLVLAAALLLMAASGNALLSRFISGLDDGEEGGSRKGKEKDLDRNQLAADGLKFAFDIIGSFADRPTTEQLVKRSKGDYVFEDRQLITDDKYKIHVHRIAGSAKCPVGWTKKKGGKGKKDLVKGKKKVVILQHGFSSNSMQFVYDAKNGLAQNLADDCFDVWMNNCRGNRYSIFKTADGKLDPFKDKEWWRFSHEECAVHDLKAMIDEIVKTTGVERFYYSGHSMGTTIYYMLASLLPEYGETIDRAVLQAVATNLTSTPSASLALGLNVARFVTNVAESNPLTAALIGDHGHLSAILYRVCTTPLTIDLCKHAQSLRVGGDPENWSNELFKKMMFTLAGGPSTRALAHLTQHASGKFQRYDYGNKKENMAAYGSEEPPWYNVKHVPVERVVHLNGDDDKLCRPEDSTGFEEWLERQTGRTVAMSVKPKTTGFGHLDFMVNKDVAQLVNQFVLDQFNKH